jgi:hypothetical protein
MLFSHSSLQTLLGDDYTILIFRHCRENFSLGAEETRAGEAELGLFLSIKYSLVGTQVAVGSSKPGEFTLCVVASDEQFY